MKTLRQIRDALLQQEDINFLLTNRVPRIALTRFMGWFSKIRNPLVRDLSIGTWRLFTELDLGEAKKTRFASMHDCFTRELKDGARPIDPDPAVMSSPCDAIVGACGPVAGIEVFQAKGFPYSAAELFGVNRYIAVPLAGALVWVLITRGSYARVEKIFLALTLVFLTYISAAILARPAWGQTNGDCTRFCQSVFPPGPALGLCISEAARGNGLCYQCGPAAPAGHGPAASL